jgi:predicted amidophosphoribosyltransferase
VLSRKAAELQAVELELRAVERLLQSGDAPADRACPSCSAPAGRADAFCAHCGGPLAPRSNGVAA